MYHSSTVSEPQFFLTAKQTVIHANRKIEKEILRVARKE